jgi:mannosyltransferase OCH1-like enzyme
MGEILTYNQFTKKYNKVDIFVEEIPKIIFRTGKWVIKDIPDIVMGVYKEIIRLNPDYKFVYFDNDDCYNFIKDFNPSYLLHYNKLIPTAYKADLFRYLLLYKYGGCYGDMTQEIYVPYDKICDGFDRVFCRDSLSDKLGLYNALMCVKPLDSVVYQVLEIVKKNIEEENYTHSTLGITGPIALGQAFMDIFENTTINLKTYKKNIPKEIKLNENNNSLILDYKLDGIGRKMIFDERNGEIIGKPKIDNHEDLLYDRNNMHYSRYWFAKRVFN